MLVKVLEFNNSALYINIVSIRINICWYSLLMVLLAASLNYSTVLIGDTNQCRLVGTTTVKTCVSYGIALIAGRKETLSNIHLIR